MSTETPKSVKEVLDKELNICKNNIECSINMAIYQIIDNLSKEDNNDSHDLRPMICLMLSQTRENILKYSSDEFSKLDVYKKLKEFEENKKRFLKSLETSKNNFLKSLEEKAWDMFDETFIAKKDDNTFIVVFIDKIKERLTQFIRKKQARKK